MSISSNGSILLIVGCLAAGAISANAADDSSRAAKSKTYPLKTCIVSDEKLGEMGKPYVFTHEGQEIKLCCKSCKKDFDKDPKKFLKKLSAPKAKDK